MKASCGLWIWLAALVGVGCDPPTADVDRYRLQIRPHLDGALLIEDQSIPVIGEHWQSIGGLGPPPYTVTLRHAEGQLTVVAVPGDTLDLIQLQSAPTGRPGNLVTLAVRPQQPGDVQLIGLAREQVYRSVDGMIALPDDQPIDLWATWHRDGRLVGMTYRRVRQASNWADVGLALVPDIPVDARVDVQVQSPPAGWATVELTIDGVRTGLVLGEGLVSTDDVIRVRRPAANAIPGGGLWISTHATDADVDVHLPLATESAAVAWPDPIEVSPRPGAIDAGTLLTRDRPLQWPAQPGLMRLRLDVSDGCRQTEWQIVAPAQAGQLNWPTVAGEDPLTQPALPGVWQLETTEGIDYAARLNGSDGPARLLPQRTRRRAITRVAGTWRGETEICTPHPAQGRYYVHDTDIETCAVGDSAPGIVVDRCGYLIPTPADSQLCGRIFDAVAELAGRRERLEQIGDEWLVADRWRLVPGATGGIAPPPEMVGDWHRAQVSEQRRATAEDGGPGIAEESALRLAVGAPQDGPWGVIDPNGRLTITLPRRSMEARLVDYDGASATFAILGSACRDIPRTATGRIEGNQLIIGEWLPDSGILRQWTLARQ